MAGYSHVIWDWNGTLLDDLELSIEAINTLLRRRRLAVIDGYAGYYKVFGFPVIDYYRRLGFDFAQEAFEKIAEEFIAVYHSFDARICLRDGVRAVLESLKAANISQSILSASEQGNLEKQVYKIGIEGYFDEILGISDIYARSKVETGLAYMARAKCKKALFIGDTLHDYEVARRLGCDCLLVAGGHQAKEVLESSGAPVLNHISQVMDFFK